MQTDAPGDSLNLDVKSIMNNGPGPGPAKTPIYNFRVFQLI